MLSTPVSQPRRVIHENPQGLSAEQRKEALFSLVRTYEALALKWETDELCELWGDAHADEMAEECWSIVMSAQVELLSY